MTALTAKAGSPGSLRNDSLDGQSCLVVLEGWKGSPGSVRNDSFDGQSGHLRPGSLRNDSFDGQSCLVGFGRAGLEMTALTAKAGR